MVYNLVNQFSVPNISGVLGLFGLAAVIIIVAFLRGIGTELASKIFARLFSNDDQTRNRHTDTDHADQPVDWNTLPKARQNVLSTIEVAAQDEDFTLRELQLLLDKMKDSDLPHDTQTLLVNTEMAEQLVSDNYLTVENRARRLYLIDTDAIDQENTDSRHYQTQVRALVRRVFEREGIAPERTEDINWGNGTTDREKVCAQVNRIIGRDVLEVEQDPTVYKLRHDAREVIREN
jgi:hypothetical protein